MTISVCAMTGSAFAPNAGRCASRAGKAARRKKGRSELFTAPGPERLGVTAPILVGPWSLESGEVHMTRTVLKISTDGDVGDAPSFHRLMLFDRDMPGADRADVEAQWAAVSVARYSFNWSEPEENAWQFHIKNRFRHPEIYIG